MTTYCKQLQNNPTSFVSRNVVPHHVCMKDVSMFIINVNLINLVCWLFLDPTRILSATLEYTKVRYGGLILCHDVAEITLNMNNRMTYRDHFMKDLPMQLSCYLHFIINTTCKDLWLCSLDTLVIILWTAKLLLLYAFREPMSGVEELQGKEDEGWVHIKKYTNVWNPIYFGPCIDKYECKSCSILCFCKAIYDTRGIFSGLNSQPMVL